jgi:hypothetical protein
MAEVDGVKRQMSLAEQCWQDVLLELDKHGLQSALAKADNYDYSLNVGFRAKLRALHQDSPQWLG